MAAKDQSKSLASKMPYRTLGRSGLEVSLLSFGSWVTFSAQLGSDEGYAIMKRAFENGVNFFDNAEIYAGGKSEEIMGQIVKRGVADKVWTREELVITTKLFFGTARGEIDGRHNRSGVGASRKHIVEGMRASLKRLDLPYVDVVFVHRPDPITPIEETVRAMNFLIDQGYTFYWGTSEWSAAAIAAACEVANRLGLVAPCCEQPQYHVLHRQRVEVEYAPIYRDYGIGLTTWSPLASGVLTGKYSGGTIPEGSRLSLPEYAWLRESLFGKEDWMTKADKFVALAKEIGITPAQLAIAWTAGMPNVSTVILGATTIAQLEENLSALEVLDKVTPEVRAKINEISEAPKYDEATSVAATVRRAPNPPIKGL